MENTLAVLLLGRGRWKNCLCSFSLTKLISVYLVDGDLDKIISPQLLGALSALQ